MSLQTILYSSDKFGQDQAEFILWLLHEKGRFELRSVYGYDSYVGKCEKCEQFFRVIVELKIHTLKMVCPVCKTKTIILVDEQESVK